MAYIFVMFRNKETAISINRSVGKGQYKCRSDNNLISISLLIYFHSKHDTSFLFYRGSLLKVFHWCYGSAWSWSCGSSIYNYMCNQCLLPLKLWVRIQFMVGLLKITLCDKVCQWLATGRWFSPDTLVSSINKTDRHDLTEILWH